MRSDKRGQFYLLAALVIVVIIVGFASVNNLIKSGSGMKLSDTGHELDFESGQVLEHGVSYDTEQEMNNLLEHFTTTYEEYVGDDKEIIFIIGDSSSLENFDIGEKLIGPDISLQAFTYKDITTGSISLSLPGSETTFEISERDKKNFDITKTGEHEITIEFNEQDYSFEIKSGENFYFVISQTIGDEEYVVTN